MTVYELIEQLKRMPPELEVRLADDWYSSPEVQLIENDFQHHKYVDFGPFVLL